MPLLELCGEFRVHPVGCLPQALGYPPGVCPPDIVVVVPFADDHPAVGRQGLPDTLHKGGGMPILVHQSMVAFVGMNGGCGGIEDVSAMHEVSHTVQFVEVVENPLVSLRGGVRTMSTGDGDNFCVLVRHSASPSPPSCTYSFLRCLRTIDTVHLHLASRP